MPNHDAAHQPALVRFLENEFGGKYVARTTFPTVGTSLARLVPNDMERMALTIINTGADDVYLTPGPNAAVGTGILLGANGGFLSLTARDDLVVVGYDFWAIASTASSAAMVIEILRYTD